MKNDKNVSFYYPKYIKRFLSLFYIIYYLHQKKKQKYNINEANLHFFTIVVAVFVLVNTLLKTFLTIPGKCK